MSRKMSAYLQVFNDWTVLPEALNSLRGVVDELVVVDGAYQWMEDFLGALGKKADRSDDRLYDALSGCGIPYRSIQRVWKNQIEKRITGYQACTSNRILRVDADEIYFFDHAALDEALRNGWAVGEMEMPLYLAPGHVITCRDGHPRQPFFFDREQVSPEQHLNYLWLVLTADKRPNEGEVPFPIFERPLAFNAHLTNWRTLHAGSTRAMYYVTNWMRRNGVPWVPELVGKPMDDFGELFRHISPSNFVYLLETSDVELGKFTLNPIDILVPSPISADLEIGFSPLYDRFLASLETLNRAIARRNQPVAQNTPCFLDVSTAASRLAILDGDLLRIHVSAPAQEIHATLRSLGIHPGSPEEVSLSVEIEATGISLRILEREFATTFRQVLELRFIFEDPAPIHYFQIRSGVGQN